ncbi:hypothetical protein CCYA_CCYA08G2408 [Cyanidiococcus yangmingshanensis]|nr:hypothetical protein CCYA_CCYA08G2408 [Cyanidiococcus yangmingshanensis]
MQAPQGVNVRPNAILEAEHPIYKFWVAESSRSTGRGRAPDRVDTQRQRGDAQRRAREEPKHVVPVVVVAAAAADRGVPSDVSAGRQRRRLFPGALGLVTVVFLLGRGLLRWGSHRRQQRGQRRGRQRGRRRSSQGEISVVEPEPEPAFERTAETLSDTNVVVADAVVTPSVQGRTVERRPSARDENHNGPSPGLVSLSPMRTDGKRGPSIRDSTPRVVSAFFSIGRAVTGGVSAKIAPATERSSVAQESASAATPAVTAKQGITETAAKKTGTMTSGGGSEVPPESAGGASAPPGATIGGRHLHLRPVLPSEPPAPPTTSEASPKATLPATEDMQHRSEPSPALSALPPTPEPSSGTLLHIHTNHPLYGMVRSSQLIAAARALELEHYGEQALFQDIFAERLAGARFMASQRERARTSTTDQLSRIPVRTRYFDDFLLRCLYGKEQGASSNEPPPRQIVILGSGLDMRAYRLKIPRDTIVYELDLPVVLEYKLRILRQEFPNHKPKALVKYVPSDLTKGWKHDLLAAGFDPDQSSVWLLEGLTYYLPEPVCRTLFSDMRSLMPAGHASWMGASFVKEALVRKLQAQALSTPRTSEESSEETFQSSELTPCPSFRLEGARKSTPRRSISRRQTFVFGTDDPEKFLKPFGFYTTAIVYLGEKGANYGRFAKAFRHTMYVTAFAG